MTCDSADRERVFEVVEKAVETYGSIDVIVNNGQAIVPSQPVEDTEYDNMLKAWQSGVIGSLNYMQAAFPYMKEQHEGRIINFASATGMFGIAGQLAYGSNKEALRGLTKIAAKEWGQYGICVNIVLPGVGREVPGGVRQAGQPQPDEALRRPRGRHRPGHRLPRRPGLLLLLRTERYRRRCQQHHAVTRTHDNRSPHATGPSPRGARCHAAACHGSAAAEQSARARRDQAPAIAALAPITTAATANAAATP